MSRSFFPFLLASPLLLAAAPAPQFSSSRVSEDIRILASDAFEGREPGSAGEQKTVAYLIARMRAAGLQPGGPIGQDGKRSWTQEVPMRRASIEGTVSLSISADGQTRSLTQGREIVVRAPLDGSSMVDLAQAPLLFVGYGVTAPERQWDDFKDADLAGRILVVLVNDPDFETGAGDFGGKAMTYYGRWMYKFEEAARHKGAKGILIVHEDAPATYGWAPVSNSFNNSQFDIVRAAPSDSHLPLEGWITRDLAVNLFKQSGVDFDAAKKAAQRRDFRPIALKPTLDACYAAKVEIIPSRNVLGLLPGRTHPDETILYSAHWDHLGIGQPNAAGDRIYNGARDNASGTAALLELARAFAKSPRPERSVLFMALTGEEKGLLGSEYYVANPVFPLATTVGVLNMDGPFGVGDSRSFTARGPRGLTLLTRLIATGERQGRRFVPEKDPEIGGYFRSDHFPFAKAGVPAVSFENGDDLIEGGPEKAARLRAAYMASAYHQPDDEWSSAMDLKAVPAVLGLLFATGRDLANSRDWPTWGPNDEFRRTREASHSARP